MVTALFTRSNLAVSRLICWGLREPVSHCAFKIDVGGVWLVVHSDFYGLRMQSYEEFIGGDREVVWEVEVPLQVSDVLLKLRRSHRLSYDYGAFIYWAARTAMTRFFGFPVLKRNPGDSRHAFLCSEYLATTLTLASPVLWTPFRVYRYLVSCGHRQIAVDTPD